MTAHPDRRPVGSTRRCQSPGSIDGKPEELGNSAEPESDRPGAGLLVTISHMPLSYVVALGLRLTTGKINRQIPAPGGRGEAG